MANVQRILVPLDFSDASSRALEYAKTFAERFSASIELLHVVPNPYVPNASPFYTPLPENFLDDLKSDARKRLNEALTPEEREAFKVRGMVIVGDPLAEIVSHAARENADLIVMGTNGRKGMAHVFLGSVAERVVRTAPCPVLTVR
jgi:nucleotide-binding universal stress UspA family protein